MALLVAAAAISSLTAAATALATPDGDYSALEVVVDQVDDAAAATLATGGSVLGSAPGVLLVEVPSSAVSSFRTAVAELGGVAREPVAIDARPETGGSPDPVEQASTDLVASATAWHAAGYTGHGIRVGIVDYFDMMYWDSDIHGPEPVAGVTARCFERGGDCTHRFFDGRDDGGEDHGIAVVEIVRTMAPDAEIFIGQATTITDYRALVDWFDSNGVTIINRSLGSRYDGPGDGRGPLGELVADTTARGMTWINSGGNNGDGRYYRHAVRLDANRVTFGSSGVDTFLEFEGCVQLAGIRWANDWDVPPAERTDYDAFLWDSPRGDPSAGRIVESSTFRQQLGAPPIEYLGDDRCPSPGNALYLEVRLIAGDPAGDVLEIADYGNGIAAHTQAASSAAVPVVDSDDRGVVAVGAIDPPAGTRIAPYSSRGPTNDGRIAPDLAAPARFQSIAAGGSFAGSSAAAAVVTGGATLLLDADLALAGHALGDLLRHTTVDRGADGPDHAYGHGQFVLPDPPDTDVDRTPSTFVALDVPRRVLDTRPNHAIGPDDLIGDVWTGKVLDLPVVDEADLPADEVKAVAVNITSAGADRLGHVQAMPTLQATIGRFSNLNIDRPGQTRANLAIVPVGEDGSISIHSIVGGNIVVDLLGWFRVTPDATPAGRFVGLADAQRVMDSRHIAPTQPLASGEVRPVPMPLGIDVDEVDALVVTITATRVTAPGWVQAIPAARSDVAGTTSTLNVEPGDVVANAAIVPVDGGGIALTSFFAESGTADVIVDVTGYITNDAAATDTAGRFVAVRPDRAFDSRRDGGPLGDREVVTVDAARAGVPSSARGVVWNLTIAGASRAGHAQGWATNVVEPDTSLLNWSAPGAVRASSALTAVDAARANFQLDDGSADLPDPIGHFITDVFGYFT